MLLDRVCTALHRTQAVIADGHHRFAAARANARAEPGMPGSDAVLALVTPMGSGGLRVAAIHRVLPDLGLDAAVAGAEEGFHLRDLPGTTPARSRRLDPPLARDPGRDGIPADRRPATRAADGARPTPSVAAIPAEAPSAWRGLDVVLAHHGLLAHLLHRGDDPASVLVAHSVEEAVRTAAERSGVALLLRAPSPAAVAAVARAGARMPRKSTLFVPKPRTGLVLRPLAD